MIDSCSGIFEIEMVMLRHLSSDNGMTTLLPPSNNDAQFDQAVLQVTLIGDFLLWIGLVGFTLF